MDDQPDRFFFLGDSRGRVLTILFTSLRFLVWLGCLMVFAGATSVAPVDFKCPVCGKPSVDSVLMSYNNFGGPLARDRVFDLPGVGVRICPYDLYASWGFRWDELKPGDKESLVALLKEPRVILSEEERKIIGMRWDELRETSWWQMFWARTCDQARKQDPDGDHARFVAFQFHYAGDPDSPEPWIQELWAALRRLHG